VQVRRGVSAAWGVCASESMYVRVCASEREYVWVREDAARNSVFVCACVRACACERGSVGMCERRCTCVILYVVYVHIVYICSIYIVYIYICDIHI
jgi:hypothetical protein